MAEAGIVAPIRGLRAQDDVRAGHHRQLDVIAGTHPAIGKAHHSSGRVARAGSRRALRGLLFLVSLRARRLLGLQRLQSPARLGGATRDILGTTLLRRPAPPLARRRIALSFRLQLLNPTARRVFQRRQLVRPAERALAGTGPHLGAVDRNLVQPDHPFGKQRRQALRQQAIQHRSMSEPKVAEPVVVHPDPAAQPAIRNIALAQPVELARRADPFERRVQPQRQINPRVRRRPTRLSLTGQDPAVQRRQIQSLDESPDHPRSMIRRKLAFQIDHVPSQLPAIRYLVPSPTRHLWPPQAKPENHNRNTKAQFFHTLEGRNPSSRYRRRHNGFRPSPE